MGLGFGVPLQLTKKGWFKRTIFVFLLLYVLLGRSRKKKGLIFLSAASRFLEGAEGLGSFGSYFGLYFFFQCLPSPGMVCCNHHIHFLLSMRNVT